MDDAARMYELQKVDLTWEKVRRRLLQIQKLVGETEELKSARQQVDKTTGELHQWRAKQKDAELESRALAGKIKSTEDRLMSGEVRNPKELESLQLNLDSMRRHRASVDDSAVEALMQADELTTRLDVDQSTLDQIESTWNSSQSELRQEETKLKQHFVLLKRKRESLAGSMGPALVERYENLRKRKAGVAVAVLQNGTCDACHVQVPTGVVSTVRGGSTTPVLCPSCGRILYSG
jgi:uncharacterized protein